MTTTRIFAAVSRRTVLKGILLKRSLVFRGLALLAGASFFSALTWAGGAEVSGFGGGITVGGGLGTHGVFGGSGAVRIGDHIHVFGDINHSTILSESISGVTGTAGLTNFGGGVDYSFGSSTTRLRPYVMAALGAGHFSAGAEGVSVSIGNSVYSGFGGGVRVYVGEHWGVKPEVRYQRYLSSVAQGTNSALYTVGLFYQFGDR
ncbi:MAG: hypothetical protein ABSG65_16330 [Bryobacteraceae bacterium]|jgi:hypothetical protein